MPKGVGYPPKSRKQKKTKAKKTKTKKVKKGRKHA